MDYIGPPPGVFLTYPAATADTTSRGTTRPVCLIPSPRSTRLRSSLTGNTFTTVTQFMAYRRACRFSEGDVAKMVVNSGLMPRSFYDDVTSEIRNFDPEVWRREGLRPAMLG